MDAAASCLLSHLACRRRVGRHARFELDVSDPLVKGDIVSLVPSKTASNNKLYVGRVVMIVCLSMIFVFGNIL